MAKKHVRYFACVLAGSKASQGAMLHVEFFACIYAGTGAK
jgi:hypothetical protein